MGVRSITSASTSGMRQQQELGVLTGGDIPGALNAMARAAGRSHAPKRTGSSVSGSTGANSWGGRGNTLSSWRSVPQCDNRQA